MKKILVLAGAASLLASPIALAEISVYGKVHLAGHHKSPDEGDSTTELESYASRLGFKGSHKINDSLKAIFQYEIEVDVDGDNSAGKDKDDFWGQRNQYAGLQGGFGKLIAGIHDTPTKKLQGKIDQFGDTRADMKEVMEYVGLEGEERESDFVGYYSPKMAGLQFQAATMPGSYEEAQLGDAYSLALVYGDPKHKKSNFYAGLSYDSNVDGKKDDDYDTSLVRFAASAKFGNFFLGGIAEQADNSTNDSQMRYVASASYKMGDAKLMLQYANADQYYENNNNDEGAEQITAGISYSLSKEAAAYLAYSQKDAYDKDADKNLESDHVLLGFVYKF